MWELRRRKRGTTVWVADSWAKKECVQG
jgi:hypothetical protein